MDIHSNMRIEDSEGSENYLFDDVDVDELNFYIDEISEICDTTEKLWNRIKKKLNVKWKSFIKKKIKFNSK